MEIKVALIQIKVELDAKTNLEKVSFFIGEGAKLGAQVVLIPELWELPYFCFEENPVHFSLAQTYSNYLYKNHFQNLAQKLKVVIPVSFFEYANPHFYNSLFVVDSDGSIAGLQRKAHIPQGPGCLEKFYFTPTGEKPRPIDTKVGRLGFGICWDLWFPEWGRSLCLQGAELLLFPSAIGFLAAQPDPFLMQSWHRSLAGQAVANGVGVVSVNRCGVEGGGQKLEFCGGSVGVDYRGEQQVNFGSEEEGVKIFTFNSEVEKIFRGSFGLVRDRRADLY